MKLKSYFNPTRDANLNQVVEIRNTGDAAPASPFVLLGELVHEGGDNTSGMQKISINHAIYSHVQEQLYLKHKIQDMQKIKLTHGGTFKLVESFTVDRGQTSVKPGEKITLQAKVVPADATHDGFYVTSHNPELVTITDKTNGKFEVVFKGDGVAILTLGIIGTQFEVLIPTEAWTVVKQN